MPDIICNANPCTHAKSSILKEKNGFNKFIEKGIRLLSRSKRIRIILINVNVKVNNGMEIIHYNFLLLKNGCITHYTTLLKKYHDYNAVPLHIIISPSLNMTQYFADINSHYIL